MVVETKNIKILIVDDMPLNIRIFPEILPSDDPEKLSEDIAKRIELISKIPLKRILPDIFLPDDGYKVCIT